VEEENVEHAESTVTSDNGSLSGDNSQNLFHNIMKASVKGNPNPLEKPKKAAKKK
jgi:hypothetical protein